MGTPVQGSFDPHGETTETDALMFALDGQHVSDVSGGWIVTVIAIHKAGAEWWVQIARDGDPDDTVVLHILPRATATDALAALAHLQPSQTLPNVIDVAPRD